MDLLESWQGKFGRCQSVATSRVIPHCLMWGIWRERNARTFEECETSISNLKLSFLKTKFE